MVVARSGLGRVTPLARRRLAWSKPIVESAWRRDGDPARCPVVASTAARRSDVAWATAGELVRLEPAEHRSQQVVGHGVLLVEHLRRRSGVNRTRTTRRSSGTRVRSRKPRSSIRSTRPVALDSDTFEDVGEPAHRHLAAPVERVQDVELRHADAVPEEPFAHGALELRHRGAEVGDDADRRVRLGSGSSRFARPGQNSSCHVNYHSQANHPVNMNDPFHMQESRCASC